MERIVFLRSGYDASTDTRLEKAVYELKHNGNKVFIVNWDRSKNYDDIIEMKIEDETVPCHLIGIPGVYGMGFKETAKGMVKFNWRLFKCLIKNRKKYNIIHACDFDTVLPAYIISKIFGKKLVYDIFDFYSDSHEMPVKIEKIIKKIDIHIINHADAVLLCNEERKEQIKPATPRLLGIIHNTPKSINIDFGDTVHDTEAVKIVYVGGLEKTGRYIKEMVDAIAGDDRFEIHIGGYGPLESYVKAKAEKEKNIVFYGIMKYDQVLKLENQCDIMTAIYDPAIKNHRYAAPNKFYEALYIGKPLIVISNTGVDKQVKNNGLGWILDDQKDFSEEFKKVLDDVYRERKKLGNYKNKMNDLYKEEFCWEIMAERLLKVYEQISISLSKNKE